MNSLSLLIYFAGVVQALGTFIAMILIISLFLVFCIGFLLLIAEGDFSKETFTGLVKTIKYTVITVIILASIQVFLPSRQTVLLIAASEMGEKVLNNEKVGQVIDPSIDLITTWMKNETAEIQKKMETKK
jgi:hypothetical protein